VTGVVVKARLDRTEEPFTPETAATEYVRVGREILDDSKRAPEIHYGHEPIGAGVRGNEFGGGASRLDLLRRAHRGIIEKQNQVAALTVGLKWPHPHRWKK